MERVNRGLVVRRSLPAIAFAFDQEQLGGIEGREDWQEICDLRVGRDFEFARREIKPGGMQAGFVESEGAEVMVARSVELVRRQSRAGREDAGELAPDEFARGGR